MTDRKIDINGWYEVKENPLSKVGVFPYTGAMIDPRGEFGLDPKKIYNVMRPQEELEDPETIESFKLVPWIDGHVMLGEKKDGLTPAEEKGISGVIGENVFFDEKDQMLKGNVKVFAEGLKDEIENGKKELSLGYRCKYEKKDGIFNGQDYDFVQKCIRGNHMASVDEGRMGSEVAVLDGNLLTFTIDSKEFEKMPMTAEEMEEAISKVVETVMSLSEKVEGLVSSKTEDADPEKKTEDADPEKKTEDMEDPKKKDSEAMDSLNATIKDLTATVDSMQKNGVKTYMGEISKRNTLAESLSQHIGTFDHAEMTLADVAVYGAEKLELKCEKGSELATVNGFLHNRQPSTAGHGLDSSTAGHGMDGLDDYIKGDK
jgi:hypothetical protein